MIKIYFTFTFILLSFVSFGQSTNATTEKGEKVILKQDGTWQYAEMKKTSDSKNFTKSKMLIEPTGEKKNQSFLKRINATVEDMKKHVSVDTGCQVDKIILKNLSEQLGNAIYVLDVCDKSMKYRRSGSVFFKDGDEIFKTK